MPRRRGSCGRRCTGRWCFPEVFERGGFDAVIGNPPFLGGQEDQRRDSASAYREYLVDGDWSRRQGQRRSGRVLRAPRPRSCSTTSGQTGLIATNTLAQGDTREVGLDQLVADGVTIRRAIKSEPWPSRSAVLEYCAVWTSRAARVDAGGAAGRRAWSSATSPRRWSPASRVVGNPHRLAANAGRSFQGSNVLGMGFTMEPDAGAAANRRRRRATLTCCSRTSTARI